MILQFGSKTWAKIDVCIMWHSAAGKQLQDRNDDMIQDRGSDNNKLPIMEQLSRRT
jgi:hypothetical protein